MGAAVLTRSTMIVDMALSISIVMRMGAWIKMLDRF